MTCGACRRGPHSPEVLKEGRSLTLAFVRSVAVASMSTSRVSSVICSQMKSCHRTSNCSMQLSGKDSLTGVVRVEPQNLLPVDVSQATEGAQARVQAVFDGHNTARTAECALWMMGGSHSTVRC